MVCQHPTEHKQENQIYKKLILVDAFPAYGEEYKQDYLFKHLTN